MTGTANHKTNFGGVPIVAVEPTIPGGCYLVYYFLIRDEIRCDPQGKFLNGSNEGGMLFQTLPEAEAFAESAAELNPRVGAGIYSSAWNVVGRYVCDRVAEQEARANAPARSFLWAAGLLLAGTLLLWLEWRSGWTLIIGFLIGSRLLVSGILKLAKGMYRLRREARTRQASDREAERSSSSA